MKEFSRSGALTGDYIALQQCTGVLNTGSTTCGDNDSIWHSKKKRNPKGLR
jgi:hypothetical protein